MRSFAVREQCRALSFVRAKLVLTRTKLATRGTANSKEHEVQVTATRRGGRVGRACGTAGPRTSPSDARENVPSEKTNEHENFHRARPAGWPVGSPCGFLSRTDAGQVRMEPAAKGSRRETSLNHRHFVDAHPYRMRLHTQGGFCAGARGKPAVCRSACQRGVQAARESSSQTTLHSATHRIAAQLV